MRANSDDRYKKSFEVVWADLDPLGHVRHSKYTEYAVAVRTGFLADHGFNLEQMQELSIGPLLLREFIEYRREARLGDIIEIDLKLKALSQDGSRWIMQHNVYRYKKRLCTLDLEGGWLNTKQRKLTQPPTSLAEAVDRIPKAEGFFTIEGKRPALQLG